MALLPLIWFWLIVEMVSRFYCKTRLKQSQSKTMEIKWNKYYNPNEDITSFSPELAIYYADFIGISYCFQGKIKSGECCDEDIEKLHWTRYDSNYTNIKRISDTFLQNDDDYNFQLLFSHKYRKVLILFPGTRLIGELFTLLANYASVPFNNSDTQQIFKFYNTIYEEVKPMAKIHLESFYIMYPQARDYQTILAGHSLGGVIASLFAYEAITKNLIKKKTFSPIVITYGQPRIGNSYLVDEINRLVPLMFRVVRKKDEVPQLPFFTIECMKGDEECPDKTIYKYIHTKGLKMMNEDMTHITQCTAQEGEDYNDEQCENKFNLFQILEYHLYYFWNDRRINNGCPSGFVKQSNQMKTLKK